jgi:hypothetical protein
VSELKCCKRCGAFLTCDHKGECCVECVYFDPVDIICMAGPELKSSKNEEVDIEDDDEIDEATFLFEDDDEDDDFSDLPPERDADDEEDFDFNDDDDDW